jgi:type II secretion system protein C
VIGLLAARIIWFALYGASPALDLPVRSGETVGTRGAVSATARPADVFRDASRPQAEVSEDALPRTSLDLVLYGVRAGGDPRAGSAIIEAGADGQRAIAAGGRIAEGVTLEEVREDRVIISRRGVREVLMLRPREGDAASEAGSRPAAPPAAASGEAAALRLMDGLRAHTENGGFAGIRVEDDPVPDLISALGLQAGDIITALDGHALDTPEARAILSSFPRQAPAEFTVRRRGETISLRASQP